MTKIQGQPVYDPRTETSVKGYGTDEGFRAWLEERGEHLDDRSLDVAAIRRAGQKMLSDLVGCFDNLSGDTDDGRSV